MNAAFTPVTFSTAFSLALHAVLIAVILLSRPNVMQATGDGVDIELVRSSYLSDQDETELAADRANASMRSAPAAEPQPGYAMIADTVASDPQLPAVEQVTDDLSASETQSIDHDAGDKVITASTRSSAQNTTIIELLHSSISQHKQYPYLAMRQRREGVARVEFVLHPDGAINGARLVQSSRTRILDKAALDAVKRIEPFKLAKDYLEKPEAFQVDVVFNVM